MPWKDSKELISVKCVECSSTIIKKAENARNKNWSGRCRPCARRIPWKNKEWRARTTKAMTTHGGFGTRLFKIWSSMRERCSDKSANPRIYYDRGIRVCDEWLDFVSFRAWAMNHGYKDNLTIDRIDNDKGYKPDNCRWVSLSENATHRRESIHWKVRKYTPDMLRDAADRIKKGTRPCNVAKETGIDINTVAKIAGGRAAAWVYAST